MGSTRWNPVALLIVSVFATLAVGTAGAQARSATPHVTGPVPCRVQHVGATQFCAAVEQRRTIRRLKRMELREAQRAHVPIKRKLRPLGWNVHRLRRVNHWHRRNYRLLQSTPTPERTVPHEGAWLCIHHGEGAWNDDTGNGYFGGLQFDRTFEESYGRDMLAKYGGRDAGSWTPIDQMIVAERAYESGRGFAPWPVTSVACGLR